MIQIFQRILNEVKILQSVDHPNVIKLEDFIDTADYLFIVLELAEGGELFDKIIDKTKLNETEAKLHFYQIASAIKYLHSKVCVGYIFDIHFSTSDSWNILEHLSPGLEA